MACITPQQAGGVNVAAFLDMLAGSEGTDNGKQPTKGHGYDVIVGGQAVDPLCRSPARAGVAVQAGHQVHGRRPLTAAVAVLRRVSSVARAAGFLARQSGPDRYSAD